MGTEEENGCMPTLEWIGKDKVVNHHLEVPYRVLEHQYTYLGGGQTGKEIPDGNRLFANYDAVVIR
jgi:adenine-specific DNA-methyltransferase